MNTTTSTESSASAPATVPTEVFETDCGVWVVQVGHCDYPFSDRETAVMVAAKVDTEGYQLAGRFVGSPSSVQTYGRRLPDPNESVE